MTAEIDFGTIADKNQLHQKLKEELSFPDYYGCNLDALFDLLMESHDLWEITFTNSATGEKTLGSYFECLKETFQDAENEGACLKTFWI